MNQKKTKFEQLLHLTDYYAQNIQFTSFGNKKQSTLLGSFCTILVFVPCLIFFYQNIEEAVNQTAPIIYQQQIESPDPPIVYLDKQNFTLTFFLTDQQYNALNKSSNIYNLQLQQCVRTRDRKNQDDVKISLKCTPIPLETCNLTKHYPEENQRSYFQNFQLINSFCIDSKWSDTNRAFLQGYGGADSVAWIQIIAQACQNSTEFNECASPDVIEEYLKNVNMFVYQSSNLFDQSVKGSPYKLTTSHLFTGVSSQSTKLAMNYYTQDKTVTNTGLLQTTIQTDQAMILSHQYESSSPIVSKNFLNWIILLDNKEKITFRSYQKLQNILGNISGLYNLISTIVFLIIQQSINRLIKIQQALPYFFEEKQKLNQSTTKSLCSNNKTSVQNILNSFNENKNKQCKFSLWQILNCFFYYSNNILQEEIDIVEQSCDINILTKKFIEYQKLKRILLDKNQLMLLDQLQNVKQIKEQTYIEKLQNLEASYKQIMQKKEKTIIDEQLLQNLDKNIIQLFQDLKNRREMDMQLKSKYYEDIILLNQEEPIQNMKKFIDLRPISIINTPKIFEQSMIQ